MRTEQALADIAERDAALLDRLEAERDQGWPEPFDWAAWRSERTQIIGDHERGRGWHLIRGDRQQQLLLDGYQPARRAA